MRDGGWYDLFKCQGCLCAVRRCVVEEGRIELVVEIGDRLCVPELPIFRG